MSRHRLRPAWAQRGRSGRAAAAAFVPTDLASLAYWFDGSDPTTLFVDAGTTPVTADADLIYQVNDKAGAITLTQATSGDRPTYKVAIQNGLSVARCVSADRWLSADFSAITQPGTVFAVVKNTSTGLREFMDGITNRWMMGAYTGTEMAMFAGTWLISATAWIPYFAIMCGVFNGASSILYRNGAVMASGDAGAGALRGLEIGSGGAGFYPWVGDLAEIAIFDALLSDADKDAMGAYLSAKWGLAWAPVVDGPVAVVAFGDSITSGTGASSVPLCYAQLVAAHMGWTLTNSGISATVLQNTDALTNNGRDTYTTRVNTYNPDRVIILYGLNDLRYNGANFSVALFESDLGEVVDGIVGNGTPAANILIGSPPYIPEASYTSGTYTPYDAGSRAKHASYTAACAAVATAKGTGYVDVYQYMTDNGGDSLVSGDGIHPNDAGHAAIAAAILAAL